MDSIKSVVQLSSTDDDVLMSFGRHRCTHEVDESCTRTRLTLAAAPKGQRSKFAHGRSPNTTRPDHATTHETGDGLPSGSRDLNYTRRRTPDNRRRRRIA